MNKNIFDLLNIKLSQEQKKHYPSVKWLVSNDFDHLRTGRSLLIIIGLIDYAFEHRNTPVSFFDHYSGISNLHNNFIPLFKSLILKNKYLSERTIICRDYFIIKDGKE